MGGGALVKYLIQNFIQNFQINSGAHTAPYTICTGLYFSVKKAAECNVDQLPPSSAQVMNVCSFTSILSV